MQARGRLALGGMLVAAIVGWVPVGDGRAQSGAGFEIRRSTIDGGGGRATGGAFEVIATIGQPDAGASSGGVFELRGGFWAGPPAADAADSMFADGFE